MTTRMFPKAGNVNTTTVTNGRTVTSSAGFVDVADHDAKILQANGWVRGGFVGPTSARPAPLTLTQGDIFIDTTVAAVIQWEGAFWRNMVTGASV